MSRSILKAIVLLAFLVALLALAHVDRELKGGEFTAPQLLGPGLIVYFEDVPGFWRRAAASPPGQVASEHFGRSLNDWAVSIRKATGIRPTPTRWQVWLGKRAWVHWTPEQTVVAVKPGVLLNTYLWLRSWWVNGDAHASFWEGWWMHRHEGMLYLSALPDWRPELVLTWPTLDSAPDPQVAMVRAVLSNGAERWLLSVTPDGDWPIDGLLKDSLGTLPTAAEAPLDMNWPMPVMVSVTAADSQGAALLSRMGLDALGCEDSAPTLFNLLRCVLTVRTADDVVYQLARASMEDWLRRAAAWEMESWPLPLFDGAGVRGVALLDIELDGGEALPVLALAARTPDYSAEDAALRWPEHFLVHPYQWHGVSGFRIPLLNDRVEVCYASERERIYGASRESVMEQLMAHKPAFEGSLAQAMVKLDWAALGEAMARDRRALFQAGYFPGEDQMAFEQRFSPVVAGMQQLGGAVIRIEAPAPEYSAPQLRGALFEGAAP